jgi:hypothetical protein
MPAAYLTLEKNDLFKSGGSAQHLVRIPAVDDIVGKRGLALYNSVGVVLNETLQYFLTFDDVIKFTHFGKGLGQISVEGTLYSDCDGDIPGLKRFTKAFSQLRGKEKEIEIGGTAFTVVVSNAQTTIVNEPDTMAHFLFNFSIVNHQL